MDQFKSALPACNFMKQVIIEVSETGEVKIEAVGFKGNSCDKATEAFEKALGVVKGKKRKPEYLAQTQKTQTT